VTKVLLTVTLDPRHATISDARHRLQLTDDELDEHFGVVLLDGDAGHYAIRVDDEVAARLQDHPHVHGLSSDARIETFGPPDGEG
jgi:hypothetical protein